MFRKMAIGFCWLVICAIVVIQLLVFSVYGALVVIPSAIVALLAYRTIRSLRRREAEVGEIERRTPVVAAPGLFRSMAESRSLVHHFRCRHLTRGVGELEAYQDGSMRFVTLPPVNPVEKAYSEMNPARTSVWRLCMQKFKLAFNWTYRGEFEKSSHDLAFPFHGLRFATAVQRSLLGPSIVIGHVPPGADLSYEEFFLKVGGLFRRRPEALDPSAVIRDLGLAGPSSEMREAAVKQCALAFRRTSQADLLASIILTVALAVVTAAFSFLVWESALSMVAVFWATWIASDLLVWSVLQALYLERKIA